MKLWLVLGGFIIVRDELSSVFRTSEQERGLDKRQQGSKTLIGRRLRHNAGYYISFNQSVSWSPRPELTLNWYVPVERECHLWPPFTTRESTMRVGIQSEGRIDECIRIGY
jgi:hypothetical protein